MNWHKIAENESTINWQPNNLCLVVAGTRPVTVARFNGQLFAFAHQCPHAGGILAEGYINAMGHLTCPLHRYRFGMKNGRNTSGEGYFLKTYAIENREDGIYIGLDNKGLWPSL